MNNIKVRLDLNCNEEQSCQVKVLNISIDECGKIQLHVNSEASTNHGYTLFRNSSKMSSVEKLPLR